VSKSWHYPKWRRVALQFTLWGIFAATVGLAALVDRHKQRVWEVPLGEAVVLEDVTVRLPAGWAVIAQVQQDGYEALALQEPGEMPTARRLSVLRDQTPTTMTAKQYLLNSGILPGPQDPVRAVERSQGSVDFGPAPGIITISVAQAGGRTQTLQYKYVTAAIVLPARGAMVIRLEGAGPVHASDDQLVRRVASSVVWGATMTRIGG
jgi:hypothetical protein